MSVAVPTSAAAPEISADIAATGGQHTDTIPDIAAMLLHIFEAVEKPFLILAFRSSSFLPSTFVEEDADIGDVSTVLTRSVLVAEDKSVALADVDEVESIDMGKFYQIFPF